MLDDHLRIFSSSAWGTRFSGPKSRIFLEKHTFAVRSERIDPYDAAAALRSDMPATFRLSPRPCKHVLHESLLFEAPSYPETFVFRSPDAELEVVVESSADGEALSDALCYSAGTGNVPLSSRSTRIVDAFADAEIIGGPEDELAYCKPHSIRRFQHASLELRGEHNSLLIDPHFHSAYYPNGISHGFLRPSAIKNLAGILISHSHADHFDIASLMQFPRDTVIVVPFVPRSSILCFDMKTYLLSYGFTRVKSPKWYETISVGEMDIVVLPFWGEQPWRVEPTHNAALRNWGNTYLVRAPQYSAWIAIDSGVEYGNTAVDLARQITADYGPPDLMLSTLRHFKWYPKSITGDGRYWWALSSNQMLKSSNWNSSDLMLTLGPRGVAHCLVENGIKYFAPYAHLFNAIGEPAGAGESYDPFESEMVSELMTEIAELHPDTKSEVLEWRVGDSLDFQLEPHHARICRSGEGAS